MKNCAYCGRENSDEATHCAECGSAFTASLTVPAPTNYSEADPGGRVMVEPPLYKSHSGAVAVP